MKNLKKLISSLCEEIDIIADKGVSQNNIDMLDKATHTLKNLYKIEEYEEEGEYSSRGMNYSREYVRDGGMNRDGGYSRDSYGYDRDGYSNRHWVRGHYSRDGKDDMKSKMEEMIRTAQTERERDVIRSCMDMLGA
jgi:hypothetical protein